MTGRDGPPADCRMDRRWLLVAVVGAFVVLTLAVRLGLIWGIDLRLAQLSFAVHTPWLDRPNQLVTELASPEVTGVATAALALWLWREQRLRAVALAGAFVLSLVIEAELKRWLHHPSAHAEAGLVHWLAHPSVRQALDHLFDPQGWAKLAHTDPVLHNPYLGGQVPFTSTYPSGHLARFVLLAATVTSLGLRRPFLLLAWVLVLLLAVSRVYTLAHWSSDVLGGVLLGWGLAIAVALLSQWEVQRRADHWSRLRERRWPARVPRGAP